MIGLHAATALALLGLYASSQPAVEEDGERKLGWANAAELSLVLTAGNSETSTFGFRNELSRVWTDAKFLVEINGIRTKTGTIARVPVGPSVDDFIVLEETRTELTAEKYLARAKYDRNVSERIFLFASSGWDKNVFAGIENRYFGAGGIGTIWLDEVDGRFRTDYGLSVTREDGTVAEERTFAGLRVTSDFMRKLTDNTTVTNVTVLDENLSDTSDLRVDALSALAVSMADHLALKLSLQLLFDADPSFVEAALENPRGFRLPTRVRIRTDQLDTLLSIALVVSF